MKTQTVIASAAVGFAIGSASIAVSATAQTVPSLSFRYVTGGSEVDAPIPGGTWAGAGLAQIYVDGYASSGGSMTLDLVRYSWNGTRTEQAQSTPFLAGQFEISLVPATWIFTNPSQWDYYTFVMTGPAGMFTSQVGLNGVGVFSR